MKRIFLHTELSIFDYYGINMIDSIIQTIKPTDMIFIVSFDGENSSIVSMVKLLRSKGVYVVSITDMKSNPLAVNSNDSIYLATTKVTVSSDVSYKLSSQYFLLVELLFLKFKIYKMSEQNFNY